MRIENDRRRCYCYESV